MIVICSQNSQKQIKPTKNFMYGQMQGDQEGDRIDGKWSVWYLEKVN